MRQGHFAKAGFSVTCSRQHSPPYSRLRPSFDGVDMGPHREVWQQLCAGVHQGLVRVTPRVIEAGHESACPVGMVATAVVCLQLRG